MVKIPATAEGVPAIRQMIAEGRNINVTLIFSLSRYEEVIEAYLSGLEALAASGGDLSTVHSVASFFVSRVDTEVDRRLDKAGGSSVGAGGARRRWLRPSSPTGCSRNTSPVPVGTPWRPGAPTGNDRCGRRHPPRTPPIPTSSTSTT